MGMIEHGDLVQIDHGDGFHASSHIPAKYSCGIVYNTWQVKTGMGYDILFSEGHFELYEEDVKLVNKWYTSSKGNNDVDFFK